VKLVGAKVTNYRSVRDSTEFEIEELKTILVGPNEAGKTAILRALQQINPPNDVPNFDALRDYPRGSYNDITIGKVDPAKTDVVVAKFGFDDEDKAVIQKDFQDCIYVVGRRLDNSFWHRLDGGPNTNSTLRASSLPRRSALSGIQTPSVPRRTACASLPMDNI
jgi:energy-coupling factor transporter ATP-binding protein EcfA2